MPGPVGVLLVAVDVGAIGDAVTETADCPPDGFPVTAGSGVGAFAAAAELVPAIVGIGVGALAVAAALDSAPAVVPVPLTGIGLTGRWPFLWSDFSWAAGALKTIFS